MTSRVLGYVRCANADPERAIDAWARTNRSLRSMPMAAHLAACHCATGLLVVGSAMTLRRGDIAAARRDAPAASQGVCCGAC